jgi:hypothetical protein
VIVKKLKPEDLKLLEATLNSSAEGELICSEISAFSNWLTGVIKI